MGLARIFGFGAAFLFASSVVASTIDVGPSNWRNYGPNGAHTGGGVQSTFGQNVRLPPTVSGPTRVLPVSRNAVIPYGSIANGAKNFLRINPASVAASGAITGLFLGVDWFFDEVTGSWSVNDQQPDPESDIYWFGGTASFRDITGPNPEAVCRQIADHPSWNNQWEYSGFIMSSSPDSANCELSAVANPANTRLVPILRGGDSCTAPAEYIPALGGCFILAPRPVDDSDFVVIEGEIVNAPAQIGANAAADIQRQIGSPLPGYTDNPMTGPDSVSGPSTTSTSTDPVTGDTTVTETSSQTYINYGDTTITTNTTTTTTTYENGQETSTTVETETPGELPVSTGGGASGDWPGFCDWATVVCDWLDWTREDPPPEQDLPQVIDDDFYQEKQISFGSKSCPEPYPISLAPFMETTVGVSFQPLCDFAGLIYYMVMAASYIIAAYISIGVARNA